MLSAILTLLLALTPWAPRVQEVSLPRGAPLRVTGEVHSFELEYFRDRRVLGGPVSLDWRAGDGPHACSGRGAGGQLVHEDVVREVGVVRDQVVRDTLKHRQAENAEPRQTPPAPLAALASVQKLETLTRLTDPLLQSIRPKATRIDPTGETANPSRPPPVIFWPNCRAGYLDGKSCPAPQHR